VKRRVEHEVENGNNWTEEDHALLVNIYRENKVMMREMRRKVREEFRESTMTDHYNTIIDFNNREEDNSDHRFRRESGRDRVREKTININDLTKWMEFEKQKRAEEEERFQQKRKEKQIKLQDGEMVEEVQQTTVVGRSDEKEGTEFELIPNTTNGYNHYNDIHNDLGAIVHGTNNNSRIDNNNGGDNIWNKMISPASRERLKFWK